MFTPSTYPVGSAASTQNHRTVNDPVITHRFTCTASRFNGLHDLIEEVAHDLGLNLEMRVKKGWLFFTMFCVITGQRSVVNEFCRRMNASIQEFLERTER